MCKRTFDYNSTGKFRLIAAVLVLNASKIALTICEWHFNDPATTKINLLL